jgi:hypothetical protein
VVPALAIAVNPVPIIVAVTLLAGSHGKRDAGIFAATLVVVMLAVGVLTIFVLGAKSSSQGGVSTGSALAQTAFGLIFLALFAQQWRTRPATAGEMPGWMTMMDKAGLIAGVVGGLALTNYALLTAGTAKIREAGVDSSDEAMALAFFIVLAVSTVVLPLIVYLVRPVWARKELGRLKDWLTLHNRVILMIVFGLMGALFAAQGVSNLLN